MQATSEQRYCSQSDYSSQSQLYVQRRRCRRRSFTL